MIKQAQVKMILLAISIFVCEPPGHILRKQLTFYDPTTGFPAK